MLVFVSPCWLFNLVILLFIINNYESLWTRHFCASFSHTLSALTILYYQPLLSWLEERPVRHLLKVTRVHMLILQSYCFSQTSITQISCLGKSVYWGYWSYFWISFSKKNSEREEENSRYRQQLCSVGNTLLPGWWTIKRHWWVSFRDNRREKQTPNFTIFAGDICSVTFPQQFCFHARVWFQMAVADCLSPSASQTLQGLVVLSWKHSSSQSTSEPRSMWHHSQCLAKLQFRSCCHSNAFWFWEAVWLPSYFPISKDAIGINHQDLKDAHQRTFLILKEALVLSLCRFIFFTVEPLSCC